MSSSSSDPSQTLDIEKNEKRVLWLGTYFYAVPWNILDLNPNCSVFHKCGRIKPKYIDMAFEFHILRMSELHFRIFSIRSLADHSIVAGNYVFQFFYDTNVFEDQQIVYLQSDKLMAYADFWLNASYREDFSSNDLKNQVELKISIQMIEYDCVYQPDICHQIEKLYKSNESFKNHLVLRKLCYILQIRRLEDAFAGRQNEESAKEKRYYISRITRFSTEIINYLRRKIESTTASLIEAEHILSMLLNGKQKLSDTVILTVYYDAQYLSLHFLIELSRDCLLYRLSNYETNYLTEDYEANSIQATDYEYLLFHLLKAAVYVNDGYLFEKCAENMTHSKNSEFDIERFLKKLEMLVHSRFVLYTLQRRREKIESRDRIGLGAAETERILELL